MREQRQGAGLARHVAQDQLHEARLESQAGHARGLGDGPLELFVAHGPEQDLIVCDRPRQLWVVAQLPVEVGAHADHDRRGQREQSVDEGVAARLVLTQRVELLELIDDDQLARIARRLEPWLGAGNQNPGALDRLDFTRQCRGDHAGAQYRRLAASRGPYDRQQPTRRQAREDLVDDILTSEEEPPVAGLERQQPPIGRLSGGQRRADRRSLYGMDFLRRAESAQPVRTEVDQLTVGREVSGHERGRRGGYEDLAAVGLPSQPRRQVDGRPEVVGSAAFGLARVQPETDRET